MKKRKNRLLRYYQRLGHRNNTKIIGKEGEGEKGKKGGGGGGK